MKKTTAGQPVKRRKVTFSYEPKDADEVILLGDFNHWDPKKHPMKKDVNGVWTKSVMLTPGTYEYKFLVDGEWREDPRNDRVRSNCFGTLNNVLELTGT